MNEVQRIQRLVLPVRRRVIVFAGRRQAGNTGSESPSPDLSSEGLGMDSIWSRNSSAVIEKATIGGEVLDG